MEAVLAVPAVPVGTIKSSGEFGEPYEVGQRLRLIDNGDWLVGMTLVKTGQLTE